MQRLYAIFFFVAFSSCTTELGPPARELEGWDGTAIAYDLSRERLVRFGGKIGGVLSRDIFELEGGTWSKKDASGPSARNQHVMGFDPQTEKIIVFGGACEEGCCGDTWSWDGAAWTALAAENSPSARRGASMVADGGGLLLIGGSGCAEGDQPIRELWRFDGEDWRQEWP